MFISILPLLFLLNFLSPALALAIEPVSGVTIPSDSCGHGWSVKNWEWSCLDDNICHNIVPNAGIARKMEIYKGCKCEVWSTTNCGDHPDWPGGLEGVYEARDKKVTVKLGASEAVIAFLCYRI